MKCKFFGILLLAFLSGVAQNVNIPDANFKSLLLADLNINTNNDAEISIAEADAYTGELNETHFGVWGKEINNIAGIEAFVNVTSLKGIAYINDTLDLKMLTKLERVDLNFSNSFGWAGIDISNLSNLSYCKVNGSSFNQNLIVFEMGNLSSLDSFDIKNVRVDSLDFANATKLTYVSGSREPGLVHVNLSNTPIIQKLELSGGDLLNIDLSQSPSLKYLTIPTEGSLTSLDFSNNPKLVGFEAIANSITSINFGSADSLEFFDVRYNQLTEISLPNSIKLDRVSCNDNQLITLDLKNSPNLRILTAYNNTSLNEICVSNVEFANNNPLSIIDFEDGNFSWSDNFYIKDNLAEWSNCISTGVTETRKKAIQIFPNPANDYIIIESMNAISSIFINDNLGRVLEIVPNNFGLVDVSNLSAGIYYINIKYLAGEMVTEKVLIK